MMMIMTFVFLFVDDFVFCPLVMWWSFVVVLWLLLLENKTHIYTYIHKIKTKGIPDGELEKTWTKEQNIGKAMKDNFFSVQNMKRVR